MGRTLQINGEGEEHEEDKTVAELKEELGIPEDDTLTYDIGGSTYDLNDQETVGDIPEDSTVAPLPDSGRLFG